jgi:hypothetical protein
VNVEAKALDRLCRSIFLEMSCLGTRVPANPKEVEHHLVAQFVVLRTVAACPSVDGEKNFQKRPDFHYDLPQTTLASSICLRATII